MAVGQAHASGLGEAGRRVCASGERPVDEREASSDVPWRRPTARGCCLGRSDGRTFRCPPFRVIPARPVAQRASRAAPLAFTFRLWTLACFQRGARAECAAARGGLHWARPASRCWVPRSFCARPTPKTNDLRGRRAARKQKAAAHLSGDLSESPFETWVVRLGGPACALSSSAGCAIVRRSTRAPLVGPAVVSSRAEKRWLSLGFLRLEARPVVRATGRGSGAIVLLADGRSDGSNRAVDPAVLWTAVKEEHWAFLEGGRRFTVASGC